MSAITTRDIENYNLALNIANNSQCRYKHGALITRGGNILSTGINVIAHKKGITLRYGRHCITIHAEIKAVLNCRADNVQGTILYSARIGKNGKACISKPCEICAAILKEYGIYQVVYFDGTKLIKERL